MVFKLIRRIIAGVPPSDERLITLIAGALKAGVVVNGEFEKTTAGRVLRSCFFSLQSFTPGWWFYGKHPRQVAQGVQVGGKRA